MKKDQGNGANNTDDVPVNPPATPPAEPAPQE